jgi:hypothetical protein
VREINIIASSKLKKLEDNFIYLDLTIRSSLINRFTETKFSLSLHDRDDSIKRVTAEASRKNVSLIHPMIGEEVEMNNLNSLGHDRWWEKVG